MRTDLDALAAFVARCADDDAQRYLQAIDNGDTWVRCSPNGLVNGGHNALADLDAKLSWMNEHGVAGPGLCERCSDLQDWPVAWPCSVVRLGLSDWRGRPGWWPGWDGRGRPRGYPWFHRSHRTAGLLGSVIYRLEDYRLPAGPGRPARAACAWIAHHDGVVRACQCGTHTLQTTVLWTPIGGLERLELPDRLAGGGYLGEEARRYAAGRMGAAHEILP